MFFPLSLVLGMIFLTTADMLVYYITWYSNTIGFAVVQLRSILVYKT